MILTTGKILMVLLVIFELSAVGFSENPFTVSTIDEALHIGMLIS